MTAPTVLPPRYYPAMKPVNPVRKSEQDAARANKARVGWSVALMWTALAIPHATVSWICGARPLIEAHERLALRGWQLYDVAEFAVGDALIALATLTCAVAAALRLPCYGTNRMDKMWLIAAPLGTLVFPMPMMMPADMKPRI